MTGKTFGTIASAFGVAVVLTNSIRSLDWLHPVQINVIGFLCIGIGAALRLFKKDPERQSTG
jgi:hypothetical protein